MYIKELGTEGHLIKLQVIELITDMEEEAALFIKDYVKKRLKIVCSFEGTAGHVQL